MVGRFCLDAIITETANIVEFNGWNIPDCVLTNNTPERYKHTKRSVECPLVSASLEIHTQLIQKHPFHSGQQNMLLNIQNLLDY